MKRRALLRLVGATAATSFVRPLRLHAQPRSRPALVGVFITTDVSGRGLVPAEFDAFHQAMRDFGYVEGQNISYVYASKSGQSLPLASLPALAVEFVRQKPEVIVSLVGCRSYGC